MKFLSLTLLALGLTLGLTGCPSSTTTPVATIGCSAEQAIASATAAAIATGASCTNLAAISGDINNALNKVTKLCAAATPAPASSGPSAKGAIANAVCPLAVDAIMGLAVSQIPPTWGCSGGTASTQISTLITTACQAIPF